MQKVIIDVPNLSNPQNVVNGSLASALIVKAYKNGIFIPKDATNGDMIKAMFPNIDFTEMTMTVHATVKVTSNGVKGGISYDFWKEWWNAPYTESEEK